MKITLVPNSYPPQIGGLEVAVSCIARELANAGNRVTVVTGSPSDSLFAVDKSDEVSVYRVPFSMPRIVTGVGGRRLLFSLWRTLLFPVIFPVNMARFLLIIGNARPDVVNLHYLAENAFYCLLARKYYQFKFVVNIHGSDIEGYSTRFRPAQWLTRKTLRVADHVISNSTDLLVKAMQIEPSVKGKSSVIGNAVYSDDFCSTHKMSSEESTILCIANFSRVKGQDILIRAFAQLRVRLPNKVRLVFAGDGQERARCCDLAENLGVGKDVVFLGKVERGRIPLLLTESTVCVIPSRKEAFGIVALEAMASRTPVIATRVGGLQEIVQHMHNGLLVAPESPDEMAEALELVLGNQELSIQLSDNGYQLVVNNYNWQKVVEKYIEVFRRQCIKETNT